MGVLRDNLLRKSIVEHLGLTIEQIRKIEDMDEYLGILEQVESVIEKLSKTKEVEPKDEYTIGVVWGEIKVFSDGTQVHTPNFNIDVPLKEQYASYERYLQRRSRMAELKTNEVDPNGI